GIGGVRRKGPGYSTSFHPHIDPPVLLSSDTIYNEYNWFRQDTTNGVFLTEFLGGVRLSQINSPLNNNNVNINLGSSVMSLGTLDLLPELSAGNFGNMALNNLDTTHNGWIYYASVKNDSFPILTINSTPIRLIVANCFDSL